MVDRVVVVVRLRGLCPSGPQRPRRWDGRLPFSALALERLSHVLLEREDEPSKERWEAAVRQLPFRTLD